MPLREGLKCQLLLIHTSLLTRKNGCRTLEDVREQHFFYFKNDDSEHGATAGLTIPLINSLASLARG